MGVWRGHAQGKPKAIRFPSREWEQAVDPFRRGRQQCGLLPDGQECRSLSSARAGARTVQPEELADMLNEQSRIDAGVQILHHDLESACVQAEFTS
jgi:hypothetical protein